jgi:hypothetical protein
MLLDTTYAVRDGGVETRFLRRHQMVVLGAIGRRGMGPKERPSVIKSISRRARCASTQEQSLLGPF